jgi:hypothetical protein
MICFGTEEKWENGVSGGPRNYGKLVEHICENSSFDLRLDACDIKERLKR